MNKKSSNQENLDKIKVQTIKKGYKQTEIGVIPEDWGLNELDDISNITRLAGYEYSTLWEEVPNGEIIALRGFNIGKNQIIKRDFVRISNKLSNRLIRSRLFKGDVVYPCVGTIGNAVVIEEDNKYHIQQNIAKISPTKHIINPLYLAYYLMSDYGLDEIKKFNGTSSQPNVLVGSLRKYLIITPTLEEQKAIAQVLSDTDQLIQNLKTLIAKKKAIKQGAMQELLTGKKRLQGFTEEWEVKKLGEVGKTISGLSGKTKTDFGNGNAQYITFMNVMSNVVIDTSILENVNIKQGETQNTFKKGDLFFNTSSETPEEVGMCAVLLDDIQDVYLNSFCFGYRLSNEELNGLYLSYLINSNIGRSIFEGLAQGATRYNLSKTNFNNVTLNVPQNIKEQQAIAQILSDMDTEIEALEQQLQKTQTLKQGMMQELLTGKTRLIVNDEL